MALTQRVWFKTLAVGVAFLIGMTLAPFDALMPSAHAANGVEITKPTVRHSATPYGVDHETGQRHAPRFSWQLSSPERGVWQEKYQIRLAPTPDDLDTDPTWDSGWVDSDQSTLVDYTGADLQPQTRYYWQVRAITNTGETSWSEPTWFETGLATTQDWQGEWISAPGMDDFSDGVIELDLTVEDETAFGLLFRSSSEGAYMWQFNDGGDSGDQGPMFRPHSRGSGGWSTIEEISLESDFGADLYQDEITVRVELDGENITTFINDDKVDERTDSTAASGAVGLRTNGSESGLVSRVYLENNGETALDVDLRDGANPFDGGTSVSGEGVRVEGNAEVFLRDPSDSPMLRTEETLEKEVTSARLYASALGVYEWWINGERVGDEELAPGWTDYDTRTQYQTYDVTDLLTQGDNAFGVLAGPGWYSGHQAWFGPEQYGTTPAVSGFIDVEFSDGTTTTITTNDEWVSGESPITYSDLLMGETYDARLEQPGWAEPGFDDSHWLPVVQAEKNPTDTLVAQVDPPVRITEELPAISVEEPEEGVWVFDLGQNMVGRARVNISGNEGDTVRIRHAEVTHPDGNIAPENLRSAKATDYYTFAHDGEATYEPRFTFHGFRYVEITGVDEAPTVEDVTGVVLHTDGELTSSLETSDPMVNQLQSNIVWGQRGNFLSIPTDTPARDERLGWTGDINVFAPTATFNMDSASLLRKWMDDMRDAQLSNGAYPEVAPQFCTDPGIHPSCGGGSTGWADAGITVPWEVWQRYGDTQIIEENYDSMTAYIDFLQGEATNHIRSSYGSWGDWLNFDDPTPANVLATAFYAHSVDLMADMAEAIGRNDDAEDYRLLFNKIRDAYIDAFISEDGTINGNSQTGYAISIEFGLVPEELVEAVGDRLDEAVADRDGHLATGFLGTPSLLPALSRAGHPETSYQLLLNRTYPSWGFQIDRGATTMWERWDSIKEDGSFGDLAMNSFNHFAYGAVGDWMYRDVGGISIAEPGHKKTLIAPKPGGGLTHASATYESIHGAISSAWELTDAGLQLDVTIPANTSARVELPATHVDAVMESGSLAEEADGVNEVTLSDGIAGIEIESGTYSFFVDTDLALFGELRDAIDNLAEEGDQAGLSSQQAQTLDDAVEALQQVEEQARNAYLDGQTLDAAEYVHDGLATAYDLAETLDEESALDNAQRDLDEALTQLSTTLLGIKTEVEAPEDETIPGGMADINLQVTNSGEATITQTTWANDPENPWEATEDQVELGDIDPETQADATLEYTLPSQQEPGVEDLATTFAYTFNGTPAHVSLSTGVSVGQALEIDSVTFTPEQPSVGDVVTAEVTVVNTSETTVNAHARVGVDEQNMHTGATSDIAGGETTVLKVDMVVPYQATQGGLEVPIQVGDGDLVYASTTATIDVDLGEVAIEEYDFIDLGEAESEEAHNLTASENSDTEPNEAGKTRRYTDREDPDGFFEFDMKVPAGEPFVVQAMETFDGDRLKNYHIEIDGVPVYDRLYQRSDGEGVYTYQFIVDDPDVLDNDGTVRIRFHNNDQAIDYDPSIAEVRTLGFHDYVDLGDYLSEEEHDLSASDQSGTNVEAGKTRRYADREDPDGYYEFDLAVTPGEPFLVRALETYDRAHTKEYDVFIDDVLVHQRLFTRDAGEGLETYQFLVDDPDVLDNDGTVRIRFQNNPQGRNYDASLAEVWAFGVPEDDHPPVVSAHITPHTVNQGWHDVIPTVTLNATDDRPGEIEIEYRFDDGSWQTYDSPFTVEEGTHTLSYRATDEAGNTSTVGEQNIQVDTTPPEVQAEITGETASGWYGADAQLVAQATDEGSGVDLLQYRIEDEWVTYDDAVDLPEGDHTIEVRARDVVGHWSPTLTLQAQVDTTPPVVEMSTSPQVEGSEWITTTTTVTLEARDDLSGVSTLEINQGDQWQEYTGPITLSDGVHTLAYRASDQAGNTTTPVTSTFKVDTQAPTVDASVNDARELHVDAHDDTSGVDRVEYSTNGGQTWRTYQGPSVVPNHLTQVQVRAVDKAGLYSETLTLSLMSMTLDPQAGHPGEEITVTVGGLQPGQKVKINPEVGPTVKLKADSQGQAHHTFTIDTQTEPGTYTVVADGPLGKVMEELKVVAEGEEIPTPEQPDDGLSPTPDGQDPDGQQPDGSLPIAGTTAAWLLVAAVLLTTLGAMIYSHHRGRSRV